MTITEQAPACHTPWVGLSFPEPGGRVEVFEEHRGRLVTLCRWILGSAQDSEDVLQDAWLRWSKIDRRAVVEPRAFLTTMARRLCVDRLRRDHARREVAWQGSWLGERPGSDPEAAAEVADEVSAALRRVLERLTPTERAVFLAREVFGESYPAIAELVGRQPSAVRQILHRARCHLDGPGEGRYPVDEAAHAAVVRHFRRACRGAGLEPLITAVIGS